MRQRMAGRCSQPYGKTPITVRDNSMATSKKPAASNMPPTTPTPSAAPALKRAARRIPKPVPKKPAPAAKKPTPRVKKPAVPKAAPTKVAVPKKLPNVPGVPPAMCGQPITVQLVLPPAKARWATDLFIKTPEGTIYHVGSLTPRRRMHPYTMTKNSSEAERAAYAKLLGIPVTQMETLYKAEVHRAEAKQKKRNLESLRSQARLSGYNLVKMKPAPTI